MKRFTSFFISILILFVISSVTLYGEIKLPAIFGDNMVLQQQSEVAIWGTAEKNSIVEVSTSWNNKSYTSRSDKNGEWEIKASTPSAGGPYEISLSDGSLLRLENIMIGEVWVCSGQSNMEMPMKGYMNQPVTGSNETIANSTNPAIRILTVKRARNNEPLDDFPSSWKNCEPESVSEFSATAYYFGLMLNKILKVPIGLISSSFSGTRIEPWMSAEGIKKFDWITLPDSTSVYRWQHPSILYNAMINPMVGFGIRGVIWYQGESNRNEPVKYQQLLPGLIENWRSIWDVGEFPFYYVQISPYDYRNIFDYRNHYNSAYLREAQLKASVSIPNSGMVCTMDAGEKDVIHPANKAVVGNRLALLALAKTYGKKGFAYEGPLLKEMIIEGNQVKLTFNNAPNGLTAYGKELSCFEVAASNKRFFPAKAFITGTGITLFSMSVDEPVAVRYAFKDFIMGDLFNTEGLPASSFRTDEWPIE